MKNIGGGVLRDKLRDGFEEMRIENIVLTEKRYPRRFFGFERTPPVRFNADVM